MKSENNMTASAGDTRPGRTFVHPPAGIRARAQSTSIEPPVTSVISSNRCSEAEADRFFGRPEAALTAGLQLVLRPPVEVRDAFAARHAELMAAL